MTSLQRLGKDEFEEDLGRDRNCLRKIFSACFLKSNSFPSLPEQLTLHLPGFWRKLRTCLDELWTSTYTTEHLPRSYSTIFDILLISEINFHISPYTFFALESHFFIESEWMKRSQPGATHTMGNGDVSIDDEAEDQAPTNSKLKKTLRGYCVIKVTILGYLECLWRFAISNVSGELRACPPLTGEENDPYGFERKVSL